MADAPAFHVTETPVHVHSYSYKPKYYYLVGKRATINELNVGLALEKLGIPFIFQVEYYNGKRTLGGQVVDFVIYAPFATPLQVYGEYWHGGQRTARDKYNEQRIQDIFGRPPIIIWEYMCETVEDAVNAIRSELHL